MRKKISFLLMSLLLIVSLTSCGGKQMLLFLNWGEYIDEEVLQAFEDKYNCTVSMDLGESNEIFYSKVRGGTTVYDVVCPSDYMVEKMYMNDMLEELDFSKFKLSGYNPNSDNIRTGVKKIFDDMDDNLKNKLKDNYKTGTIKNYAVPYLWGTWGIMYSTEKEGLEKAILSSDNQWSCLFDRNFLPSGTKVAMYDSHQHAYYAACKYLGYDNNVDLPQSKLNTIRETVKNMKYDAWGTDNIKKDIVAGNIDVGFMWTGDFLYYYSENAANLTMEAYLEKDITLNDVKDMIDTLTDSNIREYKAKNGNTYDIGFDLFIPDDTVAFCDNLVITKDSANKDLAYKFVDFMSAYQTASYINKDESEPISYDEEDTLTPSYSNTYYVDYDAVFVDVYNDIVALKDIEFEASLDEEFKDEINSGLDPYDSTLYWIFYDYAIGKSFDKYYPIGTTKGSILATFTRNYVNTINTTFNNARA